MSNLLVNILRETIISLLPRGVSRSIAYTREMPLDLLKLVIADPLFEIPGWMVRRVVDSPKSEREVSLREVSVEEVVATSTVGLTETPGRQVSEDGAVRLRDSSGDSNLLYLIDPDNDKPGLAGIFGAGLELTESQIVGSATALVLREKEDLRQFLEKAVAMERDRAPRLTPRHSWHNLKFMCDAAADPAAAGRMLVKLELWPVRSSLGSPPTATDVENAHKIVNALFDIQKARTSAEERVAWLRLPEHQQAQERDLVSLIHRYAARPVAEALKEVERTESLWLGAIDPRAFTEPTPLDRIVLQSWRTKNHQAVLAWSGLRLVGSDLSLQLPRGLGSGHLAVRWKTLPVDVPPGSVTYRVDVRSTAGTIATLSVPHKKSSTQAVRFAAADFDDASEGDILPCTVEVSVEGDGEPSTAGADGASARTSDQSVAESPRRAESEPFLLSIGDIVDPDPKEGTGRLFPSMALAVTSLPTVDRPTFEALARDGLIDGEPAFGIDKQGNATFRFRTRAVRAGAPRAIYDLARRWSMEYRGATGRWRLRVRADGSPECVDPAKAEFVPFDSSHRDFDRSSTAFAAWASSAGGPVGALYHLDNTPAVKDYVDDYGRAMRNGPAHLALMQTVEVVSVSGRTIGLIVLPTHPLRVAWQQAFDMLVCHFLYEERVPHRELCELLVEACAGTQCPAMLPGTDGARPFVFGDALGFHAIGLVVEGDPEPKATLSLLRRALAGLGTGEATQSETTVGGIASQVEKYLDLNRAYTKIRVHGLRAGDGATLARAIGKAVTRSAGDEDSGSDDEIDGIAVELNLHPASDDRTDLTGRHLSLTAERSRKGIGVVPEPDRWIMGSAKRPGGREVPRLTWARRKTTTPDADAHLAVMFDIFTNDIQIRPQDDVPTGNLELYGLFRGPQRVFGNDGIPQWIGYFPTRMAGAMHPADDRLSKRLMQLHGSMLDAVARSLGHAEGHVPVSVTRVSETERAILESVHERVDWAITADRNAGIEYFDSPDEGDEELSKQHATYVIDAVPERSDLGTVQLVTSTSRTDQLQRLLAQALGTMNLPADPRHASRLLQSLKQLSGRLTMRLASGGTVARELAALAHVQQYCGQSAERRGAFPSLTSGYFVPLDDVQDLFGLAENASNEGGRETSGMRTDLLHVTAGRNGPLSLTFVEVKYRRSLVSARSANTILQMEEQVRASRTRWNAMFGERSSSLRRAICRMRLARILTFYLQKAQRYGMTATNVGYVKREIDKLALTEGGLPDPLQIGSAGYVFCPEYVPSTPDRLAVGEGDYWVFGPGRPDALVPTIQEGHLPGGDAPTLDLGPRPGGILALTEPPSQGDDGASSASQGDYAVDQRPAPQPLLNEADEATSSRSESTTRLNAPRASTASLAQASEDAQLSDLNRSVHPEPLGGPLEATSDMPDGVGDADRRDAEPVVPTPTPINHVLQADRPGATVTDGIVLGYLDDGHTPVIWRPVITSNPHLMIVGLPGMGKTSALLNLCEQLINNGIYPIIFSYHEDIDEKLVKISSITPSLLNYEGLGFNPMRVESNDKYAHTENAGTLRDIFGAIFPDLGDVQLGKLRESILKSYTDRGWARGIQGQTPPFSAFYEALAQEQRPDKGLNLRLKELADFGFFDADDGQSSLLDVNKPIVIQIHKSANDQLQRAFATFMLYSIYQSMFRRGLCEQITHAIIFDEAHRASKLKMIPTMAKECRKYGLSFILASQELRDFHESVFNAIDNYLALRVNATDARVLARRFGDDSQARLYEDRIKALQRYHGYYFGEQVARPVRVRLIQSAHDINR